MECGNCYKPISKGEPLLVVEWYQWNNGKKTLLGREIQHAEGYGCQDDDCEIKYPHDMLPPISDEGQAVGSKRGRGAKGVVDNFS